MAADTQNSLDVAITIECWSSAAHQNQQNVKFDFWFAAIFFAVDMYLRCEYFSLEKNCAQ